MGTLFALPNDCSPVGRFVLLLYGKQIDEVNLWSCQRPASSGRSERPLFSQRSQVFQVIVRRTGSTMQDQQRNSGRISTDDAVPDPAAGNGDRAFGFAGGILRDHGVNRDGQRSMRRRHQTASGKPAASRPPALPARWPHRWRAI